MTTVPDPSWPKPGDPPSTFIGETCPAANGFFCTEPVDHDGPHVASGFTHIAAVWTDDGYYADINS